MKVCLVPTIPLPPSNPEPYIPLGLLTLVACLEKNGLCDVEIWDAAFALKEGSVPSDVRFFRNSASQLAQLNADMYGFSTKCGSYAHTLTMVKHLRYVAPDAFIVLGGPHASSSDTRTLNSFPFIDAVIRGEGESPLQALVHRLDHHAPIDDVPSLTWRSGLNITRNPDAKCFISLDRLPFPAYDRYSKLFQDYTRNKPSDDIQSYIPVEASRGCPYNCNFCYSAAHWKGHYRSKSSKRVAADLLKLRQLYGVEEVFFTDDIFTLDQKQVAAISRNLAKLGAPVRWSCYGRTDHVDARLLKLMADGGCAQIYYGIESGSPRILRQLRKPINIDETLDKLKMTIDHGIQVTGSFIMGFPGETREELGATLDEFLDVVETGAVAKLHQLGVVAGSRLWKEGGGAIFEEPSLEQQKFRSDYLISDDVLEMIKSDRELFCYYYRYAQPNLQRNLFKIYRIEFLFPIFLSAIKLLRLQMKDGFSIVQWIDDWALKNGINQAMEWSIDIEKAITEFGCALIELSYELGLGDSIYKEVENTKRSWEANELTPIDISKTIRCLAPRETLHQ